MGMILNDKQTVPCGIQDREGHRTRGSRMREPTDVESFSSIITKKPNNIKRIGFQNIGGFLQEPKSLKYEIMH
jgi:hypothetical protein